jgi:hypothetical protein
MDNVLADMVQRLRAIELLLRRQNELLTKVLANWRTSGGAARIAMKKVSVPLPRH